MVRKKKKNPLVAAVLNFLVFGLGYLYLGKRKPLGWILLISDIVVSVSMYYAPASLWSSTPGMGMGLGFLGMGLALAYDAYKEAR